MNPLTNYCLITLPLMLCLLVAVVLLVILKATCPPSNKMKERKTKRILIISSELIICITFLLYIFLSLKSFVSSFHTSYLSLFILYYYNNIYYRFNCSIPSLYKQINNQTKKFYANVYESLIMIK